MLHEITNLRQTNRSLIKRWFTCRDMDLFVWFRRNAPVRFQLCFNKRHNEHAISWDFHREFQLYQVDTGENNPDRYKKTPLFINSYGRQDLATIARSFLAESEKMEISLADFIYARLMEYPVLNAKHSVAHANLHILR